MWSDLLRYPSGDPQAQVFWRRRMSVLAVVGVLGLLLVVLVARGGSSSAVTPAAVQQPVTAAGGAGPAPDTATLPASPSATPTPSVSPSAPADRSTTCTPGSMALRVSADAENYASGQQPMLTLSVVDIGTAACVVDLGTTATSISVLSGGKTVWSSAACEDKIARPVNLTPASAQTLQVRWDRTANAEACSAPAALPAGPYEIVAAVGKAVVYGGAVTLA